MSVRFEVLRNGHRLCISGINGDGVLTVMVDYVKHKGKDPDLGLSVGGAREVQPITRSETPR